MTLPISTGAAPAAPLLGFFPAGRRLLTGSPMECACMLIHASACVSAERGGEDSLPWGRGQRRGGALGLNGMWAVHAGCIQTVAAPLKNLVRRAQGPLPSLAPTKVPFLSDSETYAAMLLISPQPPQATSVKETAAPNFTSWTRLGAPAGGRPWPSRVLL